MKPFRVTIVAAAAIIALASPAWSQPGGRSGGNLDALMAQMDADGDGAISRTEMDAAQSKRFASLDADGDGLVSEAEFVDAVKERGRGRMAERMSERMAQRFAQTDADGDGFATEAEFTDAGGVRFDRMDADGDGLVTADEMRQSARQLFGQSGG